MADVQITVVDQQDVQMAVVDQNDAQIALTPALDAQLALAAPAEAQIIAAAPTFQGAVVESIDDLSDVDTSGIVAGQILQWNGSKWVGVDFDAARYIAAVQGADGQALEPEVQDAINQFIMGCKSDGIWDAIKACCILAGARTLNGALVPLVGAAPTNVGPFVSGDYNRKTGLVGDGSTKYLNTNRNSNSDPNANVHQAVFVNSAHVTGIGAYIGVGAGLAGATHIISNRTANEFAARNRSSTANVIAAAGAATGFTGSSRNSSSNYDLRVNGSSTSFAVTADASINADNFVFARNAGAGFELYTTARLSFYSVGESLDLALLDTRVTQLMADLAAAIP